MRQSLVTIQVFLVLVAGLLTSLAEDPSNLPKWETDIQIALERSKKEGKDLLLAFRGPSENAKCKQVNEAVFDGIEFRTIQGSQFVLFSVASPLDGELDEAGKVAYRELLKRFNIEIYPIILLADSEGRVYGQTNVQQPEAKFFVQAIAELAPNRKAFDEALRLAALEGAGPAEAKQLSDALEQLGVNFVIQHNMKLVEHLIALDKDGDFGLKSLWEKRLYDAKTLKKYDQIYASIAPLLSGMKTPEEKIQLLDETISKHSMEGELRQLVEMRKFWVWSRVPNYPKMLEAARGAIDLAPETSLAKRIPRLIEHVEKSIANSDTKEPGDSEQPQQAPSEEKADTPASDPGEGDDKGEEASGSEVPPVPAGQQ